MKKELTTIDWVSLKTSSEMVLNRINKIPSSKLLPAVQKFNIDIKNGHILQPFRPPWGPPAAVC